jgi:DNA-binding response OmpR family regulator
MSAVYASYGESACSYYRYVKDMRQTNKKILIVDDEPLILKVLGIKLRVAGYDVITALNGQQALELVDSARPDIMLLDIIMPGMDGFQVLQKLRPLSDLPVIAFSARPEGARKALSLGANDFLAKPFDLDELLMRIQGCWITRDK